MRKTLLVSMVALLCMPAMAEDEASSYVSLGGGTMKVLPMGKDRRQVTWEFLGVQVSEDGKGFAHNASIRCAGAARIVNEGYEDFTNACSFTLPDGDQMFWTEKLLSGKPGSSSKGTAAIVGGTGKLAGVQGSVEWTRYFVRPAAEGTYQTVTRWKGSYKLASLTTGR